MLRMKKGQRGRLKWKELTPSQRARIVVQLVLQLALTGWALWDLRHRPERQIRGSKKMWMGLAFVQPIGPLAYLLFGRKR